MLNELKVKVKLPAEIIIHIPAFSDIEIDKAMDFLAKEGKDHILRTVKQRVLDKFIEVHEPIIGKVVDRLVKTHEREIKEILELK